MKIFTTGIACLLAGIFSYHAHAQNVGIGTTLPLTALHVSRPADTALALFENQTPLNAGTNTGIYFKNGNYYTGALKTIGTGSIFSRVGLFTFASSNPNFLREGFTMLDDGTVGIGNINPLYGGLVVDKKIGAVNALFGSNTTGVAIESALPGIGLNTYYSGGRKYIAAGYGGLISMNPGNGNLSLFVSPATGTANNAASLTEAVTINKSGNVGIGNTLPATTLDVGGTVKIADGTQSAGRVLTSDATGVASWQNLPDAAPSCMLNEYVVKTAGSGSFSVPVGITKVFVELWSGGGNGSSTGTGSAELIGGGGGGGSYAHFYLDVVPGNSIAYIVAAGGGSNYSRITFGSNIFILYNGLNGDNSLGAGGISLSSGGPAYPNAVIVLGSPGMQNLNTSYTISGTNYVEYRGGYGGAAAYGGGGGFGEVTRAGFNSGVQQGSYPGGGGGAKTSGGGSGGVGAQGQLIIHY